MKIYLPFFLLCLLLIGYGYYISLKPNTEIYSYSLNDYGIKIFTYPEDGIADLISAQLKLESENDSPVLLTNGPIFDKGNKHLGLVVRDGKELSPLNLEDGKGNFYLKPNGVFAIENRNVNILPTSSYAEMRPSVSLAFQSGPLLLHEGKIHPSLSKSSKSKFTRGAIGVTQDGKVAFGLFKERTTLYKLAEHMRDDLNCHSALYLDGAITGFLTPRESFNLEGRYAMVICIVKK
ncbi:MAG: phosphodiester glycosidase family protein [Planctomycetes bacterium]|nr:phosphodiester glycosidase family protein [Planctomycetota bacterium]